MKRPKLMVAGHARHGKDTLCEMLAAHGYTWASSSWVCGEIAVWPAILQAWHDAHHPKCPEHGEMRWDKLEAYFMCELCTWGSAFRPPAIPKYATFQECFNDRHNHRAFWHDTIADFNTPDKTKLGRMIYAKYDIYCGIRNAAELAALRDAKVIDFTIWIDRLDMPPESSDSMTVKPFQSDHTIYNNGTLDDLRVKVDKFYHGFLKPWERRLANPEPALPNRATRTTP